MSPSRQRNRFVYPVALACVAALLLASCSGSGKKATTTSGSAVPSTDAKGRPAVSLALALGARQVQAVGVAKPFNLAAARLFQKLMNNYVATSMTRPLFSGTRSTGLAGYFAPILLPRIGAKGRDRAALCDEGSPVMTTVTSTKKQPLNLVVLENHGTFAMVGARFGITVKGITAQGPLTVTRLGYFVFEENAAKRWHITGYDIIVRRDAGTSSTTQTATSTTAAK